MHRLAAAFALLFLPACDGRVLYTVEGVVTSSASGAPIPGVRVTCALADDPQSIGEAFTVDDGFYSCTAVDLDVPQPGAAADVVVTFTDEDQEQNGAFQGEERTVVVPQEQAVALDVELDPA